MLANTGNTGSFLWPAGGPWAFFKRLRVICQGQMVEDMDNYGRTHQMSDTLLPAAKRIADALLSGYGQNNVAFSIC